MLHAQPNLKQLLVVVCFGIVIMMGTTSCAAPPLAPNPSQPFLASSPDTLDFSGISAYTIDSSISIIDQFKNIQSVMTNQFDVKAFKIGDSDQLRIGVKQYEPLTQDNGFNRPEGLQLSDIIYSIALPEVLSGRSPIVCAEEFGQAFLIFDKATLNKVLDDNPALPGHDELASLVASCGEVVGPTTELQECENCTCVGPMSGPCRTDATAEWYMSTLLAPISPYAP